MEIRWMLVVTMPIYSPLVRCPSLLLPESLASGVHNWKLLVHTALVTSTLRPILWKMLNHSWCILGSSLVTGGKSMYILWVNHYSSSRFLVAAWMASISCGSAYPCKENERNDFRPQLGIFRKFWNCWLSLRPALIRASERWNVFVEARRRWSLPRSWLVDAVDFVVTASGSCVDSFIMKSGISGGPRTNNSHSHARQQS